MVTKNVRVVVAAIVFVILIIFAVNITNFLQHHNLAHITLKPLPQDSSVTLNGKQISARSLYLKPGSYTFQASRQYFLPVTKKLVIKDRSSSQIIYLLPIANTKEAMDYLSKHPSIQQAREQQGAVAENTTQVDLTKKFPIITKLPVYNSDYRIDYSVRGTTISFSVTLYAIINNPSQSSQYEQQLQQYKAEALKFLTDNGIDPSKFTITYTPNV